MRTVSAIVGFLLLVVVLPSSAGAITNGEEDTGEPKAKTSGEAKDAGSSKDKTAKKDGSSPSPSSSKSSSSK